MPSILISGAASGLGKAFLAHYARDPDAVIIAIDRNPVAIGNSPAKIEAYIVDVVSPESIKSFAASMIGRPFHLFIHSVGVRGLVPSIEAEFPDDVAKAETIDAMNMETMMRAFQVNAAGTFLLLQAILPNLRLGKVEGSPAKAIIMGSRMGSVGYNTTGAAYAYRASKAGLNAIIKSFSIDVPDVIFTTFHPGRVETGLTKCREEGAIEAEESLSDMMKLINNLTTKDTGKFYDRHGEPIVW